MSVRLRSEPSSILSIHYVFKFCFRSNDDDKIEFTLATLGLLMKIILPLVFSIFLLKTSAQTVGFFYNNPGSLPGYVLFAPGGSDSTYLIDKCGKRIHTWHSNYDPGLSVHLNSDGSLLRCGNVNNPFFTSGGAGGILEKFDWNSGLMWSYMISDMQQCQHHDAIQLPNGNALAIVWQEYSKNEAIAQGRNPATVGDQMWSDKLVEIQPVGNDSGVIVWQWNAWDHLIQDFDSTKENYGVVASHPELINVNAGDENMQGDWLHCNSIDYNSHLDQILISCHNMNEVWIIDHSTTTAEAASHNGGLSGKGGDLLYRWGNPQVYGRGTASDQKFFGQHDATWIPAGMAGEGKILVFNNGLDRPSGNYTSVETFTPPAMVNNNYPIYDTDAYAPSNQDWVYEAFPATSFYTQVEGGAQRLDNGNTLICDATKGIFFEVDSLGNNDWKYVNPVGINGITIQGEQPLGNVSFRCTFLPPDYAGLQGQILIPGAPIELNPINYFCNSFPLLAEDLSDSVILIHPDPFHEDFSFDLPVQLNHASISVHDAMGRLLYEEQDATIQSNTSHSVHVKGCTGLLLLTVLDEDGKIRWNQKLISQ